MGIGLIDHIAAEAGAGILADGRAGLPAPRSIHFGLCGSRAAPPPLANEREKLLRAYYADAIDVTTLKREQTRIDAEVAARQRPRKGGCSAPPPSDPVSIPQDIENREVATRIDWN